jgi:hypothetical protein
LPDATFSARLVCQELVAQPSVRPSSCR